MKGLATIGQMTRGFGLMGRGEGVPWTKKALWTTDARLTGYLGNKSVQVPSGELLHFVNDAGTWKLAWIEFGASTMLVSSDPGGGTPVILGTNGPAPFRVAYGYVTRRLAGNVPAPSDFTHNADCLITLTLTTRPSAGSMAVDFRRQDVNNRWQIYISPAGDFTLTEVVAGAFNNRGVAAGVVASGNPIVLVCDGQAITGYSSGVQRWLYGAAVNFATMTLGRFSFAATGGQISDIITYPRVVSGAALVALNLLNP